jgi:hypothetical protein
MSNYRNITKADHICKKINVYSDSDDECGVRVMFIKTTVVTTVRDRECEYSLRLNTDGFHRYTTLNSMNDALEGILKVSYKLIDDVSTWKVVPGVLITGPEEIKPRLLSYSDGMCIPLRDVKTVRDTICKNMRDRGINIGVRPSLKQSGGPETSSRYLAREQQERRLETFNHQMIQGEEDAKIAAALQAQEDAAARAAQSITRESREVSMHMQPSSQTVTRLSVGHIIRDARERVAALKKERNAR